MSCHGDCTQAAPLVFFEASVATAGALVLMNVIDIAALSTPPRPEHPDQARFGVVPLVGAHRGGLALAGSF